MGRTCASSFPTGEPGVGPRGIPTESDLKALLEEAKELVARYRRAFGNCGSPFEQDLANDADAFLAAYRKEGL